MLFTHKKNSGKIIFESIEDCCIYWRRGLWLYRIETVRWISTEVGPISTSNSRPTIKTRNASWDALLSNEIQTDVDDLANTALLSFDDRRLFFHTFDRTMLKLVRLAYQQKRNIALFSPLSYTDIFPFVALECIYSTASIGGKDSILVIPQNLKGRALYQQLMLRHGSVHQLLYSAEIL